jgi:hypothetical protein
LPGLLALASAVLFVVSLALVPALLVRLPPDAFVKPPRPRAPAVRAARNVAGAALIVLGLLLLVLPGQGVLTILVGLALLDLPAKERVVGRILRQHTVQGAVQRLRARAGRPPLLVPDAGPRVDGRVDGRGDRSAPPSGA